MFVPDTSVVSAGGTVLLRPGKAFPLQRAGQFSLPCLKKYLIAQISNIVYHSHICHLYLRPSEERPAGVAGDGSVVSAGLLRGSAADGAHIGRGLAWWGVHHNVVTEASIQFI